MLIKKKQRLRRARQTRLRIAKQGMARLTVNRSNTHIYATVVTADGSRVLASASTAEADMRKELAQGANIAAAEVIGKRIAERAKAGGTQVVLSWGADSEMGRKRVAVQQLIAAHRNVGVR